MKSFLIFLGLILIASAQVQNYVENIKGMQQMYEMDPPTDVDIDNLVFPEQLQYLEVEGKCVLKKLIKNQNIPVSFLTHNLKIFITWNCYNLKLFITSKKNSGQIWQNQRIFG